MAVTYGSAVSSSAPAIVDTAASQSTGAATQGIGTTGADEASIGGSRIGGSAGTDFKVEYGDGVGV
jgi:hypothetical protein